MIDNYVYHIFGDSFPELFSSITSIAEKKGCNNKPLFYDRNTKQYWNNINFRTLRLLTKNFTIISKAAFCLKLPYFIFYRFRGRSSNYHTLSSEKELVIMPSLNGAVFVNFSDQQVCKILTPIEAEPDFLDIEEKVFHAIPKHVPAIIKSGVLQNNYFYIVWKYLKPTAPISFYNWSQYTPDIIDIMFQQYAAMGVIKKSCEEYLTELERKLFTCKQKSFLVEINEIKDRIHTLLKLYEYDSKNETLFMLHCHGDLVPNNVLSVKGKLYLFDWSLGGWLNAFYDLMIQEFYRADSIFWKRFKMISKFELIENQYLLGWGKPFIDRLEALLETELSIQQIKMGCLISLLEKSVNSFCRYQHHDINFESGEYILKLIIKILKNID
ncbi:MAG: hypothetical protein H8D96_13515 [Desulfobacterales bacterium]|uniref:Uncharacterized protein n=1 Tax=Candidatus Desulfatibia vada TaxID=2841696 RepID=A0A8J6TQW7_9BACT|nr:hypothetical protein [Candidatus Desulfatibia vada]